LTQVLEQVKVAMGAQQYPTQEEQWTDEVDFERLRELVPYLSEPDIEFIHRAYDKARQAHEGQKRRSGAPYFTHVFAVGRTLARLQLGRDAIAAGLLHDVVEDTPVTHEDLVREFGEDVASLVDGVTKISRVHFDSDEQEQAENFRKMLLSMVKDVRIILVKLADRQHNMKTLEFQSEEKRRRIAQETLEIYAPLAHRMGIGRLKWQLEDLSFKYLEPEAYREVERNIGLKRQEREEYIKRVTEPIQTRLREVGIQAEIAGRAKHFYSIYKKMKDHRKNIDEMYDLLALRIIVPDVRDCYHALGIIHTLFTPVHDRFKDYIATPKSNMYRSLHTTVMGPDGHFIEIQVRTEEMHRTNEYGIAAHWKYKEEGQTDEQLDESMKWLRQMLEEKQDLNDPREFMEALKIDLFQDEIFVFTPKGDLKQLPRGSTPVDFAYAIHTEVGHKAVGARVNGRLVPLARELANGDTVEVISSPSGHPSLGWLRLARTSRARSKIRHWIKAQRYAESVLLGREMLERELRHKRLKVSDRELVDLAQAMGFEEADKLLGAIGNGDQSLQGVLHRLSPPKPRRRFNLLSRDRMQNLVRGSVQGVRVQGIGNLMVRFANCCNPVPGDRITGIVTRGRGISVHRQDCVNLDQGIEPERRIEVSWDVGDKSAFLARILVLGEDRKDLLADISRRISATGTNIKSGDFSSEEGMVRVRMIVEVHNLRQLNELMHAVRGIKHVHDVTREETP
jgi:GTP pyrophosphokinase